MSVKLLVILLLSVCLAVITLSAAESLDAKKISPSITKVVKMHESGVAPDVLLAYVNETPISKPSAEEVLYLTEKGIPKDVILALLTKRVWADNPPAQSQPAPEPAQLPPAVSTSQAVTQTVVHVQQPAPVVTYGPPYYPYYYPYYDPWPRVSVGIGFGYGWYGGYHHHHGHHYHGGWHHGGGIHAHRR